MAFRFLSLSVLVLAQLCLFLVISQKWSKVVMKLRRKQSKICQGENESYGDADLFGKKMFLTTSLIRRETFRENLFSKTQISGQLSGRAGH